MIVSTALLGLGLYYRERTMVLLAALGYLAVLATGHWIIIDDVPWAVGLAAFYAGWRLRAHGVEPHVTWTLKCIGLVTFTIALMNIFAVEA